MDNQQFVACFLLVGLGLIQAKTLERNIDGEMDTGSMACLMQLIPMRTTCREPPLFSPFEEPLDPMPYLRDEELSAICSPIQIWYGCMQIIFDNAEACANVNTEPVQGKRRFLAVIRTYINYVCEQHVDGDRECPTGTLRCSNGQCLPIDDYCDGSTDCRDKTILQTVCPEIACEPGYSKCPYRARCIRDSWFCDGDDDCKDGSDEANCAAARPVTASPHHHNDDHHGNGPSDDSAAMSCIIAMQGLEQTCSRDQVNGMFDGMTDEMKYQKIIEVELREICRPVQEWFSCAENAFEECAGVNNPMIAASLRMIAMSKMAADYLCDDHYDVVNDNKACLLRRVDGSSHTGPVVLQLQQTTMTSCSHLIPMGPPPPGFLNPVCMVSHELQECVKNLVAEQCGDEIAEVLSELGDRARQLADCPQVMHHGGPHQGPPQKKRRGYPFDINVFKSFF